jgi:hypothetical protein
MGTWVSGHLGSRASGNLGILAFGHLGPAHQHNSLDKVAMWHYMDLINIIPYEKLLYSLQRMAKCLYSATISVMSLECYRVLQSELCAHEKHWLAGSHQCYPFSNVSIVLLLI